MFSEFYHSQITVQYPTHMKGMMIKWWTS